MRLTSDIAPDLVVACGMLLPAPPWAERAQAEHDAFADALRAAGVSVLYLTELLQDALEYAAAREQAIDTAITHPRLAPVWVLPILVFACATCIFLLRPAITPHQPMASRRLVPAVGIQVPHWRTVVGAVEVRAGVSRHSYATAG